MTWTVRGFLESPKGTSSALEDCRVEVVFDQLVADAEAGDPAANGGSAPDAPAPTMRVRAVARTTTGGRFAVDLPDKDDIGGRELEFAVFAPSGRAIAEASRVIARIDDAVRLQVGAVEQISLEPGEAPPDPDTYSVTGRVIDRDGGPLPPSLQILVFAKPEGSTADTADTPVLVARADASGYFRAETPNALYTQAVALIAGVSEPVPVSLTSGRIPDRLVLVAAVPAPDPSQPDGGCDCDSSAAPPRAPSQADLESAPETYSTDLGTGKCVQFNKPNRAVEEFNFYSVVRTTEPAINGVTLTDGLDDPGVDPTPPVVDRHVSAASYSVEIDTGERGTWGAVWVNLVTESGDRYVIYAKDSVNHAAGGNPFPNTNDPTLAALVLNGNTSTRQVISANLGEITGIGIDVSLVRRIEVGWRESNLGDAWSFAGIAVSAVSTSNETVPLLINGVQRYTEPVEIRRFDDSGGTVLSWSAPAQIAARPAVASTALVVAPGNGRRGLYGSHLANGVRRAPGRAQLDSVNPVDWDSTPTFYEAATIAHGHLLHFKQTWYADGYSLGDLLYSLPLAPGQKKLVSVVDWERRERGDRAEATFASEELSTALSHDRDLGEVVTGALTESVRGGSKNTTAGVGAGTGTAGNGSYEAFNFGALLGVSGGYGESDSAAWQDSTRTIASTSLQTLRDNTHQAASAVRGLRSSVVRSVSQGEAVRATTEVVANHNHCHAITIQYFEVLRHLKLVHELTDVQECLFVPLPMTAFDRRKSLRWREALQTYLRRPELAPGFDAARRVETAWSEVDYPLGRYADESVLSISGELQLTIVIPLPPFPERPKPDPADPADTAGKIAQAVNPTTGPFGIFLAIATGGASLVAGAVTGAAVDATKAVTQGARSLADEFYPLSAQERYDKFQQEMMPAIAAGFVDQLELWAVVGTTERRLSGADFTLVSNYQPGVPLLVGLRASLPGQIRRSDVSQLIIRSTAGLPTGCRVIVDSATIRYRTSKFEHALVDDRRVNDDIDLPVVTPIVTNGWEVAIKTLRPGTGATLYTATDAWEQRNPRVEDIRLASELMDHLNDNLEYYHHAVWWTMDPNRRYMLLDGYYASGAAGRSVASVVENHLIGIVGNSLIMPVARGNHLDPRFTPGASGTAADLLEFYALESPVPASRVCLPTRGVFAEAVMGTCNACEQIDDSKFWRWDEAPIDEPPSIQAASTESRRSAGPDAEPTEFPNPLVSIQNAGAVPDPAGVRAAFDTLSRASFADITGLAGTQANAAAAYSQAVDTALQYGKEASKLAQQASMLNAKDKALGAIDSAEQQGKIDPASAKGLRMSALQKMVGDMPTDDKAASVADRLKVVDDQEANGSITPEVAAALRDAVMKGLHADDAAGEEEQAALTSAISGIPGDQIKKIETQDASGASRSVTTSAGSPGGLLGMALQTLLGASPTPPIYWSQADKPREVFITTKKWGRNGFDFNPAAGGGGGEIDGPLTHNGTYKIIKNEPGRFEMELNIGTDAAMSSDLIGKLTILNGTASVTGTSDKGTADEAHLDATAQVKGSGTRSSPFKIEFTGTSLEWF